MRIRVERQTAELQKPPAAVGTLKKENPRIRAKKRMAKKKALSKPSKIPQSDGHETSTSESPELEAELREALEKKFSSLNDPKRLTENYPMEDSEMEPTLNKRFSESERTVSSDRKTETQLTKAQKKRRKRTEARLARRTENEKRRKPKKIDEEPPTSSSIVLPKRKGFIPVFDTDEKRLAAARARLTESHSHVLQIRPVPRKCTPGLLKDLCPLAIHVRLPTKYGAQ
ncbi:NAChR subunit (ShAR1-beta2) [Fasciola gigantica]|uniref:NAChR subunit (ShAR1-beta2) n=1 Tax=Fasciola gigantica TaxID=46835 RepID=A0A504YJQ3_FASGI|nr:NAChR subunit (ShAR1-beta2) [Fasciola gigantica]